MTSSAFDSAMMKAEQASQWSPASGETPAMQSIKRNWAPWMPEPRSGMPPRPNMTEIQYGGAGGGEMAQRKAARDAGLLTPSEVYAPRPAPMQRTPVPPPGMSATGAMDDLPPLPPADPNIPKQAGWKYNGPDQAALAKQFDDEWWARHAANPPPPMRPGPEEPLPPLPPPDPEFMRALQRSMQKTGR